MPNLVQRRAHRAFLFLALALSSACASTPTLRAPVAASPATLEQFTLHAGDGSGVLAGADFMQRVAQAEVIFLGETHDDAVAHALQRDLYAVICERFEGTALSLEMLERDEQTLVDDWREGIIDDATFASLTNSENWAGAGSWAAWYQPVLDVAREHEAAVIAANAPRRYVRLARAEGFGRLDQLPAERRAFVRRPAEPLGGAYRERFFALLGGIHGDDANAAEQEAFLGAMFRSQQVWDATMAESIARGLGAGSKRVVHLVGQFHSDYTGGTVMALDQLRPGTRVLTVSFAPQADPGALAETDRGRADVVIYTGE
ncbi:MAG: ChaN family lipoprotein [Planctomycetota bacterium]|jgi:uncharacterized iron-regulated protein